jgi:hypothetical protein
MIVRASRSLAGFILLMKRMPCISITFATKFFTQLTGASSMKSRGRFILAALCMTVLALPGAATRAQSRALSAEELSRAADVVAVGRVSQLTPEWDEQHASIRTRVAISVSQFLKGAADGAALSLVVPGGEIDGVGEMYSHMPVFKGNEDVVVFARKDPSSRYHVVGGVQGKLPIRTEDASGAKYVAGSIPLAQFTAAVRSAVAAQQSEDAVRK